MIYVVKGDLLEATEEAICHQCNCITTSSIGLADLIFKKWPESNTYINRTGPHKPGSISVHSINDRQYIVNFYAQIYPGGPNINDSYKARMGYFKSCLTQIKNLNVKSVAFPKNIGCGLARGSWKDYYQMIEEFDESMEDPIFHTFIYDNDK